MSDFSNRFTEIAKRFLLTAVIVDDAPEMQYSPSPHPSLKKPDRYPSDSVPEVDDSRDVGDVHSLDAGAVVSAFAKHGLICAVITPSEDDSLNSDTVLPVARRADMVILDWQMHGDYGRKALGLLKELLKNDDVGRLRLITIYTGVDTLSSIGEGLKKELAQQGWDFHSQYPYVELTHGHCRIVIYAKSRTLLGQDLQDREISEVDIPSRLIEDFVDLTKGLLPSIALTSLAAVRENAHKVLNSFSSELDPAFLAHRACLPIPDDSQQHVVNMLDSELHAIMDDATMEMDPGGIEAVKNWLDSTSDQDTVFAFGGKTLSYNEVLSLLKDGLDRVDSLSHRERDRVFQYLSKGFSKDESVVSENLDHQLAWMFNFRTVSNSPPPILQLGTALLKQGKEGETADEMFLCIRPKCDSLRLQNERVFPLLPLINPKQNQIQLVLKTGTNGYLRRSVCTEPSQWSLPKFKPDESKQCVVAEKDADGRFFFTSTNMGEFTWIGELKAEFAQRVAQHFASGLSRVATNNSEWLRRHE